MTLITTDDLTRNDTPACEYVDCEARAVLVVQIPNVYHLTPEPAFACGDEHASNLNHDAHATARSIRRWGC